MYRRKLSFGTPETEVAKNHKLKLYIIAALCLSALILFYFYITLGKDPSVENIEISIDNKISTEELSKDIDSIAYTFGIHKDWIKNISQKNREKNFSNNNLLISKEIRIPNDLPTIDLNFEFSNYLRTKHFNEKVTEDSKSKDIFMEIYSANDTARKLAGILKFIIIDSLKRDASNVSFLLDSIDSYPLDNAENILSSQEEFSVILPLRNDKSDYQLKILDSKRTYLLKFFIGDEDDLTADFKRDMKESVWKSKVKSIAMSFQNASGIILKSKMNFGEFENDVREEFTKNNMKVYSDTMFSPYSGGDQKINLLFSDIISKSNSGKKILFYEVNFSPEEFNYFDQHVYQLKKLGFKFFNFKDMIKKINKTGINIETNNNETKQN